MDGPGSSHWVSRIDLHDIIFFIFIIVPIDILVNIQSFQKVYKIKTTPIATPKMKFTVISKAFDNFSIQKVIYCMN